MVDRLFMPSHFMAMRDDDDLSDVVHPLTGIGQQRLFIGLFPAGISYADRARQQHGDYEKVAFLSYSSLELQVCCPRSPLLAEVQKHAASMQARYGEQFQVSEAGQTVLLGFQP